MSLSISAMDFAPAAKGSCMDERAVRSLPSVGGEMPSSLIFATASAIERFAVVGSIDFSRHRRDAIAGVNGDPIAIATLVFVSKSKVKNCRIAQLTPDALTLFPSNARISDDRLGCG